LKKKNFLFFLKKKDKNKNVIIKIIKGIRSFVNIIAEPKRLIKKKAINFFFTSLKFNKKILNNANIENFCIYPPAIASLPKIPLYLSSNGSIPSKSAPYMC
jgi:hypothetical protein